MPLRAAFGARGCEQIDLQLGFSHLIPLLRNLPPLHYLINLVSAPSSAIQVLPFVPVSNSCPKCSLAPKDTSHLQSVHFVLCFACAQTSGSICHHTLAVTVFHAY